MSYETVHGGNVREISKQTGIPLDKLIDFSANINPLGPPSWLEALVLEELPRLVHYPDRYVTALIETISETYRVPPPSIVAGNGTTELFFTLPRAAGYSRIIVPVPSYGDYTYANRIAGVEVIEHPLSEQNGFVPDFYRLEQVLRQAGPNTALILAQPNNPTGLLFSPEQLLRLVRSYPDVLFCVDEAFADFVPEEYSHLTVREDNLLVFRSFTKFFAVPGLRLGWLSCREELADGIRRRLPTWSVNALAEAVGIKACRDRGYAERTLSYVNEEREELSEALGGIADLFIYPGRANFLFIRIDKPDTSAGELYRYMLSKGIIIRLCGSYSALDDRFFRIAVRTREENEQLVDAVRSFFSNDIQNSAVTHDNVEAEDDSA